MTTIAWDGASLAGDRQSDMHGNRLRRVGAKVVRAGDAVVGCCGDVPDALWFAEWVRRGCPSDDGYTLGDNFTAFVVRDGQCSLYCAKLIAIPLAEPFWAIGSGMDLAIGAMACGKDAAEAVEIAARFDTGTGGGVDVIDCRQQALAAGVAGSVALGVEAVVDPRVRQSSDEFARQFYDPR